MDDDPWGSSADPWNAGTSDTTTAKAVGSTDAPVLDNLESTLTSGLAVPQRGTSFSEADPWASPVATQVQADTAPSPILAVQTQLPQDDISVPKAEWAGEDASDLNAWVPSTLLPVSSPPIQDSPLEPVSAEQIPLPHDGNENEEIEDLGRIIHQPTNDNEWNDLQADGSGPDAVPVDLPTFAEPPQRFVEEDETYNPFSQGDGALPSAPEEVSRGFNSSSVDDDAFGGFATGGGDELGRSGFAIVEENDAYGGWGNEASAHDFGGSGGDWGLSSAHDDLEDEDDQGFQSSKHYQNETNNETGLDEGGFHSVPARERNVVTSEQLKEAEWEEARRRIESKEARAPVELINKLADQWKDVLQQVFVKTGQLDTGKEVENGLDPETLIRKDRLMRKLTELPDGMSIYVQPPQNTVTWARYQDYLSTVKLDPSASILAKAGAESAYRTARRKSQEEHDAWHSRSRLGETSGLEHSQHPQSAAAQDAEASRSKWSLWGRKASTPTVPLTTSGGGMLEVKSMSPNHTGTLSGGKSRTPVNEHSVSTPVSSRATPPIQQTETHALAELDPSESDAAPSAVGRFLGRFRRTRTATSSVDINNKDLELSQDDFSYLAEVPSLAPKADRGVGNLLSLDSDTRPSEQMASLEAMLNSKATPLPLNLKPPPRPSAVRGSSNTSTFASAPTSKSASVIDLFGDLDLSGNSASKPTAPATNDSEFDAFMTLSSPPVGQQDHSLRPSAVATPPIGRSNGAHSVFDTASALENDGFGDFTAPSHGQKPNNNLDFDDFGDFAQFQNIPAQQHVKNTLQQRPSPSTLPAAPSFKKHEQGPAFASFGSNSPAKVHVQPSPSKLDHSSTAKLVENAAASSRQWPAPLSPSIPALPPPTPTVRPSAIDRKSVPVSNSASNSRTGTPLNFDFLTAGPPLATPARTNTASPAMSFVSTSDQANRAQTPPQLSKGQGLSASDLSFFDSL